MVQTEIVVMVADLIVQEVIVTLVMIVPDGVKVDATIDVLILV